MRRRGRRRSSDSMASTTVETEANWPHPPLPATPRTPRDMQSPSRMKTTVDTIVLAWKSNRSKFFTTWFLIPLGVVTMLLLIMCVDLLISLTGVSFPASVACMFGLFIILLLCNRVAGQRNTSKFVRWLDIPCGFCLRWLNLLFTPSFVTLPLSPRISFTELLKIAGVFVFGFLIATVTTAWSVRGLTILIGRSKTNLVNRIADVAQDETIPLNGMPQPTSTDGDSRRPSDATFDAQNVADLLHPPSPIADASRIRGPGVELPSSRHNSSADIVDTLAQPRPLTEAQRAAGYITLHLDALTWGLLWLIGFCVYMGTSYAMPAQLPLNVLTFFLAMKLSPAVRRFIHPIFPCAALTILGIFVIAAIKRESLDEGLEQYRTRTPYINYYFGPRNDLPPPGAGDLLATVLDVSIVALAIPMFNYRAELKRHFIAILLPNLAVALTSLFAYPAVCDAIGIDPSRALAFPARSVTLALATPVVTNLGGSISLVVVLAILSGIIGVLVGGYLLKLLRIPPDDYVTRGVTLGINASAISTAQLLTTDPRAAALSSLSFAAFGALMVVLTAITPIAAKVRQIAGL